MIKKSHSRSFGVLFSRKRWRMIIFSQSPLIFQFCPNCIEEMKLSSLMFLCFSFHVEIFSQHYFISFYGSATENSFTPSFYWVLASLCQSLFWWKTTKFRMAEAKQLKFTTKNYFVCSAIPGMYIIYMYICIYVRPSNLMKQLGFFLIT